MEELPDEVLQEQLATDSLEAAEMVQTDTIKGMCRLILESNGIYLGRKQL